MEFQTPPPGESLVYRPRVELAEPVKTLPKLDCFVGFKVDFDTQARVSRLRSSGAHPSDSVVNRYAHEIGLMMLERVIAGKRPQTIRELCEWLENRNRELAAEREAGNVREL